MNQFNFSKLSLKCYEFSGRCVPAVFLVLFVCPIVAVCLWPERPVEESSELLMTPAFLLIAFSAFFSLALSGLFGIAGNKWDRAHERVGSVPEPFFILFGFYGAGSIAYVFLTWIVS